MTKRTGGVWDSKAMLQYLQGKVSEFPEVKGAKPVKASAKVAEVEGGGEGEEEEEEHRHLP